jgi:hypothetical protein
MSATLNDVRLKGFNLLDALHISCSISSSAKYFITTDYEILRLAKKYQDNFTIKFANPLDITDKI